LEIKDLTVGCCCKHILPLFFFTYPRLESIRKKTVPSHLIQPVSYGAEKYLLTAALIGVKVSCPLSQKRLLTTALIEVKVSCPLAKVHGRPADCKFQLLVTAGKQGGVVKKT
jgi:hypothetical protein